MNDDLKICIYAICKNEEKFIDRWYESVKDADYICVLDTGSTDNTVDLLKKYNIITKTKIITPWRFDVARNESMKLIPKDTDVCFCIDIDEIIEPGWKDEIKKVWKKDTNRLKYTFLGQLDEHGNPSYKFINNKIHSLKGYEWKSPLHEYLICNNTIENTVLNENIIVYHRPDENKSRASYIEILKQAVIDEPNDDRNMHYLGREYMYYEKYNEAIDTLKKHLSLKNATWKDERCASMRYIAKCYKYIKNYEEARIWYDKAIEEAPHLREPYVERAQLEYEFNNFKEIKYFLEKALDIKEQSKFYINESYCWDETIYDLLSLSYFYLEEYDKAVKTINKAVEINPTNQRLQNNKILMENMLNSNL